MVVDRTMLARVVMLGNGKGGVGKTSMAANIAGLAAKSDFRVLLIDLDPQGDCRDELGLRGSDVDDDGASLAATLLGTQPLRPVNEIRKNLDIVIGGEALNDIPAMLSGRIARGHGAKNILAEPLADYLASNNVDLVVLDTPPGDLLLQLAALETARWLIIPTQSDSSSLRGMGQIAGNLVAARKTNPDIDLLGVVLFDELTAATALRGQVLADMNRMLGGSAPVFENFIRTSVAGKKARRAGQLAHEFSDSLGDEAFWKALAEGRKPVSKGSAPDLAADYLMLTHEILTQIAHREEAMA